MGQSFSQDKPSIVTKPLQLKWGDVICGLHGDYKVICVKEQETERNMGVYHGKDLKHNRLVEIKILPKNSDGTKDFDKLLSVNGVDNEHFQQVYDYCHDRKYGSEVFVVVESLSLSLKQLMQIRPLLSFCEIRVVMRQLFESLQILKEKGIIHGDISLDGIKLVDAELCPLKVRLTDFSSYIPPTGFNMFLQTSPSKSPEMVLGLPTSTSVDMWSLGCVMANIYLGKSLFPRKCRYSWMKAVVKLRGQPDDYLLNHGINTEEFFIKDKRRWRLKTPAEYEWTTGRPIVHEDCLANELTCLCDIRKFYKLSKKDETERRERWAFVELLRNMLELHCKDRITPKQALGCHFLMLTNHKKTLK